MFKATLDIAPGITDAAELRQHQLLMEVGDKTFSYVVYNKQQQQVQGFRQYALDFIPGKPALEALQDIFTADEVLQNSFRESYIVYNYSDSNLLPEKHFHIELNKPVTELVYGNAKKGLLLNEKVPGWNVYNVYRIPREVHSMLQKKFAAGKYWHYYTMLLSVTKPEEVAEENVIRVIISAEQFVAVVFKQGKLQLLQTYAYQTPEDVSYHLLSVCQHFSINQEEVLLSLSGLIDEQSNLYQELLKYFLQLQWENLPGSVSLQESFQQFPQHYFLPTLKMALCV